MSAIDNIPQELRDLPQWILWKRITRDGKETKRPVQVGGYGASTTNPDHWATFDAVCAELRTNPRDYSGIGYVFAKDDPYFGIDLDDCRNPETGEIQPWATRLLESLNTYAEVSPSKTGIKAWCRGELPGGATGKRTSYETGAIEFYQSGRYFTVTGKSVGEAKPIRDCSVPIGEIWGRVFGSSAPATPKSDSNAADDDYKRCRAKLETLPEAVSGEMGHDKTLRAACEILRHGLDDERGRDLLDWYNAEKCSPSWSTKDLDHKWASALTKVMRGHEFGVMSSDPEQRLSTSAEPFSLGLQRWSEFQQDELAQRYLIPGLVVEGESLIVGGRTKGLKTLLTLDMMISLASGQPFLNHFPVSSSCPVAFVSGESGRATLQRAAAAMAKARGAIITDDNFFIGFKLPSLSHGDHLEAIGNAIRKYGIKLFCVDPAYLATLTAKTSDKAGNQFAMGLILEPFGRIGAETGCVMGLVHHAKKATKTDAYKPMTRDDLTQSGFDAWMRQWLLISRRSAFARGQHELHVEVGGSAGHWGTWHVDVDEGQPADPLTGRRWNVTVRETEATSQAAVDAQTEHDAAVAYSALLNAPKRELSRKQFFKAMGAGNEKGGRGDRAIAHLEATGSIVVQQKTGRGGLQSVIVAKERLFNAEAA